MRQQLPACGEKRKVLIFPLLPVTCYTGQIVWLEWVVIEQIYTPHGWEDSSIVEFYNLEGDDVLNLKRAGVISVLKGIFKKR